MPNKITDNLEEWLLPRGRTMLLGLVVANIVMAAVLVVNRDAEPVMVAQAPSASSMDPQIQLLAEVPNLVPVEQPPARECRIWGPEQSPEAFDSLVAELAASGSFPEVESREIKAASDYLVYIGDLGSRDNAKRIAQELEALNIDSYLINRKDAPLMLSVGVFSRESRAIRQQTRVAELGYEVVIEELGRSQTVYQLTAHVQVNSEAHKLSTSSCIEIAHNT